MSQEELIITTSRKIAKNTGALLIGTIFSKICSLIFLAVAARYFGPEGFGKYTFALSFTAMFTILGDLGLNILAIREVARDNSLISKYLGNIVILKLILSSIAVGIIFLVITLLNYPSDSTKVVYIIGISIFFISLSQSLRWCFQAFQKMEYEALVNIAQGILLLGLGFSVLYLGKRLIGLALAHLSTSIIIFCFSFLITIKRFAKPKFEINFDFWKSLIKTAIPIGLITAFAVIYLNVDTIMLSLMKGDKAVAWYNAGHRLVETIKIVYFIFVSAIFPVMSDFYKTSIESLRKAFRKSTQIMSILGLPIGIGTTILSFKIIPIIFGDEFTPAIFALQILVWAGVAVFISGGAGRVLIVINKQGLAAKIFLVGLALNVFLNLALIPKFSYIGAAIAIVIAEFTITLLAFFFVFKNLKVNPFPPGILKIIFASVTMGILTWFIRDLNIVLVIFASACFYLSVLFLQKVINWEELKKFINRASQKSFFKSVNHFRKFSILKKVSESHLRNWAQKTL